MTTAQAHDAHDIPRSPATPSTRHYVTQAKEGDYNWVLVMPVAMTLLVLALLWMNAAR